MASKCSRVKSGKGVVVQEDIPNNVAANLVKLMDQAEKMEKDMRGLMDNLLVRTEVLETEILELVEEVVRVNSHNNEIELHPSLSHAVGVSCVIIRDDEDIASILRDERVVVVFVTAKVQNANDIPHEHECASNKIVGTLQQTQLSLENEVGPLSFVNDTLMVVSDDDASDQIENDVKEDNMADLNDELHDDYENDYVNRHDDCSKNDKVEHNDIPYCNHADAITIVLEEVQCDDHTIIVELKNVEGVDLIYKNTIALENYIRLPNDSNQKRVNIGVSR
ncbi:uncharacterized protein LOC110414093 [Herrania umbratica]|uniref:Uncharacterized protein LOC110414093 n=1 Tax=Herrania umbratica TaxID=108875 RepID=A0A6J1A379_9ROSI|nr:uncharacterized protein LOC110414093 [Herrania umbratica]